MGKVFVHNFQKETRGLLKNLENKSKTWCLIFLHSLLEDNVFSHVCLSDSPQRGSSHGNPLPLQHGNPKAHGHTEPPTKWICSNLVSWVPPSRHTSIGKWVVHLQLKGFLVDM